MMLLVLLLILAQHDTDLLVNDDTTGGMWQCAPAVAVDGRGGFYCSWTDFRASDYDSDVYIQKFDAGGNRIGENRNLSVDQPSRDIWRYTSGSSDIAVANDKLFMVVSDRRRGDFDVYCQLYDLDLNPVSQLIMVNDDWRRVNQDVVRVAAAGGNYLVVWGDWREQTFVTIYGQVYDAALQPITANFRISEITGAQQYRPAVAGFRGGFVVLWEEDGTDSTRIFGRRFTTDGTPIDSSFQVLPQAATPPFCTMDSSGNFWAGGEEYSDPQRPVTGVLHDFHGAVRAGPVVVNDPALTARERLPAAAASPGRNRTLFTWIDTQLEPGRIIGQWLDSLGNRVGDNFPISSPAWLTTPHPAVLREDCFMVVWEDSRRRNQDIFSYHPQGGEQQVNTDFASAIQDFPCVAIADQGHSFVVWYDYRNDQNDADVYGQRYDEGGRRLGDNFRINDDIQYSQQHFPWVACNREGKTAVVWRDTRRGGHDIFGQRYDSSGSRLGPDLCLSDTGTEANWPIVTVHDSSGRILVTWMAEGQGWCRQYEWDGTPVDSPHALAVVHFGVFAVWNPDQTFWLSWSNSNGVYLARFDTGYRQLTPAWRLDNSTSPHKVFMGRSEHALVVTWMDFRSGMPEVFARRCQSDGHPAGEEFRVNDDNVGCEHWFPAVASDGRRFYTAFTDLRIEGDLDIMGQVFGESGERVGGNYVISRDPYPGVHQWAWGSVAACCELVAYAWIDNRNLRSWDIYFRLSRVSGIDIEEAGELRRRLNHPFPTVLRAGADFTIRLAPGDKARVRLYDQTGRLARDLFHGPGAPEVTLSCAGLAPGVYFVVVEQQGRTETGKLTVLD